MEYVTVLEKLQLNYTVLRGKFLCKSKPYVEGRPGALNDLKSYYSNVINSVRTSDYINNLEGLLRILEKRNELSYENIRPLIHIETRYVKSPELETLLRNYEENMRDYPVVPLFNVYDLHGGEYRIGNKNISKSTGVIGFASLKNNQLINRTNYDKKINHDTIDVEAASEILGKETSTEEATFFDETQIFSCNNSKSTSDAQHPYRDVDDTKFIIAKTRQRTTKYTTIVLLLIFLTAAIFITFLITMFDAQSSENSYESQRGYTSRIQGSVLQDPMTLYTTTESSFRLTIPASVQITTLPNSNNEDSQIATIVFLEVSDNLGRHWRDVARFLGVTEHDIDEIDYQPQLSLKEKALKALMKFQSKSDPLQWKPKLQRALEKARRRDLMEMVEELWSRKHRST